tara:strand:- start:368 stop:1426 length:1059 start_codon:yes stop_codon:yes gene_type:complete
MRVLVTGGAGFVGSHTCFSLLEKGYEIIVIDSYINSHKKSLQRVQEILKNNTKIDKLNIEIVKADIRDENVLDKLFLEYKKSGKPIQAVIHFAGLKSVKESVLNPLLYWDVNVNGSINLLRVMDKYNCRTIVFSSSATIYGLSNNVPLKEDSYIKPINPYGRTKLAIEQILNDTYNSDPDKWKMANLRYFNPIGAHPSGKIGEDPIGIPNNIFPYITQVAAGVLDEFTIFGNDWPTLDGTCIRDYIHVMDLAEGHIATLKYLNKGETKIVNINLGTGLGTSVLELIDTFEKVNNIKISKKFSSRRIGDTCTVIADNTLALSFLEWSPKRDLTKMCLDGWKWQSLNPKGYKYN